MKISRTNKCRQKNYRLPQITEINAENGLSLVLTDNCVTFFTVQYLVPNLNKLSTSKYPKPCLLQPCVGLQFTDKLRTYETL